MKIRKRKKRRYTIISLQDPALESPSDEDANQAIVEAYRASFDASVLPVRKGETPAEFVVRTLSAEVMDEIQIEAAAYFGNGQTACASKLAFERGVVEVRNLQVEDDGGVVSRETVSDRAVLAELPLSVRLEVGAQIMKLTAGEPNPAPEADAGK